MGANRRRNKKKQRSVGANVIDTNEIDVTPLSKESAGACDFSETVNMGCMVNNGKKKLTMDAVDEFNTRSKKKRRRDDAAAYENAHKAKDVNEAAAFTDAEVALVHEARRSREQMKDWFPLDGEGVLLLGEGDFSFTLSIALRGVKGPIVATALDLEEELTSKYRLCKSNLKALRRLGVELVFGVNATNIAATVALRGRRFSRIIFNFPHSGVPNYQKPSLPSNQELLRGIFISAAPFLVHSGGQLRVTLRKDPVYHAWNIVDQSKKAFQRLMKNGSKRALCPVSSEDFPYHFFFGYRHVATVEDRAVDSPDSLAYAFELQKVWQPPASMVAAAENVDLSQAAYPCKLCNITFRSPKQLEMHEAGRRHKEAKAQMR